MEALSGSTWVVAIDHLHDGYNFARPYTSPNLAERPDLSRSRRQLCKRHYGNPTFFEDENEARPRFKVD